MPKLKYFFKYFSIVIVSLLLLYSCKSEYYKVINKNNIALSATMSIDTVMIKVIQPYSNELQKTMNETLITTDTVFEIGKPEGLLGNLISDIIYDYYAKYSILMSLPNADFCLINNGGLRISLPKGNITLETVYSLMPFDNELVLLKLQGEEVKELFDYIIRIGGQPISNASISNLNLNQIDILIRGKAFDVKKDYYIITSDYLANGNDQMIFFKKYIERINIRVKMRDIIVENFKNLSANNSKIQLPKMGRIKLKDK